MLKGLELSPGLTVRHGLEGIGGGRGIFSTSSFRTGELVLQENPIIESPESIQEEDINLHAALVRCILQAPNRAAILQGIDFLHPVALSDLSPSTLKLCRAAHISTLDHLEAVEAATQTKPDGTGCATAPDAAATSPDGSAPHGSDAAAAAEGGAATAGEECSTQLPEDARDAGAAGISGQPETSADQTTHAPERSAHSAAPNAADTAATGVPCESAEAAGPGTCGAAEQAGRNSELGRLPTDALLRLLLAMQMNAFRSGVYPVHSLVNHSCQPNCVKFTPAAGKRSELVAVRDIAPGEEITQAYMQPFGRSEARRRTAFQEQHLTHLTPSPYCPEMDALAPGQPTPNDAAWGVVQEQVAALEDALEELEATWETRSISVADAVAQARKLRATAVELLAPTHLVQARAAQLLVDTLEALATQGRATADDVVDLVKEVALGAEHCDVATTLDSLQQAMEYLMGTDKAALTAAFPDEWPTFAKASKAQYAYQKRCKAIQKLYEASRS